MPSLARKLLKYQIFSYWKRRKYFYFTNF